MFSLIKDKNGIVKRLSFNKALRYYHLPNAWEVVHEDMARQFAKMPWRYLTVIVKTERLADKLWDDPKHAHISYTTLCSEVEEEARKRAQGHFFTNEEIAEIFKKHQFPKNRYNWEEEGEQDHEKNIEIELKDAIYDAQVKMFYPIVVEEFKRECRYEYDEKTEDEIKLSPQAVAKKWKKRQLEIFLPRVHESVERALPNTPEPFNHTTSFAQYFFIEKENEIEWIFGASSGSQTRYAHGLMGHVFATLTKEYEQIIPTYYFKITKYNEFKYVQEWKTFKVDRSELTGNYPARWEKSESLFDGLLFE